MGSSNQQSETERSNKAVAAFGIIATLFFASGFSSLIYQVVWNRLLVFLFGSTTFATASVLAVFMGGLAAGSYVGGKLSKKITRPLLAYGILEGVIGLWALAVPSLLEGAIPLYKMIWTYRALGFAFPILRLLVASTVLFLPTACMGATLPLLAKYVSNNQSTVGNKVGSLYAINTFGAVGGASLAGFALLPSFGLHTTIWIAAAINIFLFAVVALLSRSGEKHLDQHIEETGLAKQAELQAPSERSTQEFKNSGNETKTTSAESAPATSAESAPATSDEHAAAASGQHPTVSQAQTIPKIRAMILLFGISGALSMMYEVGWTRALLLVIGSSTYAFTCMLTTFLIGIFAGSWACAKVIDKKRDPILVFAVIELCIAGFALLAMMLYNLLPISVLLLAPAFKGNPELAIFIKFLLAASTFVPLTLGLGATFPAVVKSCVKALDEVGESVGTIYSANTLGAIIGALLAGFVLVPTLGVEKMLVFAAALNMILGVIALYLANTANAKVRSTTTASAAVLCLLALIVPNIWDRTLLLLAQPLRRYNQATAAIGLLFEKSRKQILGDLQLVYYADGVSATVGVFKHSNPPQHVLITNGNVDGNDSADMVTQSLLGALPLVLRPDAKTDCVIGWGTGVTSGTSTLFPLKEITSIELEQKVVDTSKFFHKVNHKAETDPRSKIEFNDGRNFLLASENKYDVIVSEPSNPWQAGVCNLFTKEFFQICHQKLNDNGILCNWAQSTEVSPDNIKGILSSLKSVFKNVAVFRSGKAPDILLLASDSKIIFNYQTLKKLFEQKSIKDEMSQFGINAPEDLLACLYASPDSASKLATGVPVNSDDHNYFEYSVQRTYETANFADANKNMFENEALDPKSMIDFGSMSPEQKAEILNKIALSCLKAKRPHRAAEWSSWAIAEDAKASYYATAGSAAWILGEKDKAFKLWQEGLKLEPKESNIVTAQALAKLESGENAQNDLQNAISLNTTDPKARLALACIKADSQNAKEIMTGDLDKLTLANIRNPNEVAALLQPVMESNELAEDYPNSLYLYALACYQNGSKPAAETYLRKYLKINPDSSCASRTLGILLWQEGKSAESGAWLFASAHNRRDLSELLSGSAQSKMDAAKNSAEIASEISKAFNLTPADPKVLEALKSIAEKNKDPNIAKLISTMKESKVDLAADETLPPDRKGENVAKLIELFAAGAMLYLLLKKSKK